MSKMLKLAKPFKEEETMKAEYVCINYYYYYILNSLQKRC